MTSKHTIPLTVLTVVGLGLGSGCEDDKPVVDQPTTIEDLTESPATHYGKRFAVAGEIEKVYDPRTFVVGGTDFFGHELLVRSMEPLPVVEMRTEESPAIEGDIVHVTGELRRYIRTELESELQWTLDRQLEAEFESKPVLLASQVLVSPRDPDAKAMRGVARLEDPVTDITLVIAAEPADIIGETVRLEGMMVRSLVEGQGFWVGPSHGRQMFVRTELDEGGSLEQMGVKVGTRVDIDGTLETTPEPSAIRSKWGLSGMQANLLDGEPLYVEASDVSSSDASS